MPEGLENDLKPADLADLIAYVARAASGPRPRRATVPDSSTPGRRRLDPPRRRRPPRSTGRALTFETEYGNLGYWHERRTTAPPGRSRSTGPTTFTVSMEWACADESAGQRVPDPGRRDDDPRPRRRDRAGTWANYRSIFVGEATLPAGDPRLEFRPDGPSAAPCSTSAPSCSALGWTGVHGCPVIAPPGRGA